MCSLGQARGRYEICRPVGRLDLVELDEIGPDDISDWLLRVEVKLMYTLR